MRSGNSGDVHCGGQGWSVGELSHDQELLEKTIAGRTREITPAR